MFVKCIANKGINLSKKTLEDVHLSSSIFPVAINEECIVYGMCLIEGILHYLLVTKNSDLPFWFPAELFQVVDNLLPLEYYFKFYGEIEECYVNAIWGYKELLDLEHYSGLIEREKKDISIFLKRKEEFDEWQREAKFYKSAK